MFFGFFFCLFCFLLLFFYVFFLFIIYILVQNDISFLKLILKISWLRLAKKIINYYYHFYYYMHHRYPQSAAVIENFYGKYWIKNWETYKVFELLRVHSTVSHMWTWEKNI